MATQNAQVRIRSDGVAGLQQFRALTGPSQFVRKPFSLQLPLDKVFAHFGNTAVQRDDHTELNTPVVGANIGLMVIRDRVVAHVKRRDVESGTVAAHSVAKVLPTALPLLIDLNRLVRIV